jgi:hypothetical protein
MSGDLQVNVRFRTSLQVSVIGLFIVLQSHHFLYRGGYLSVQV